MRQALFRTCAAALTILATGAIGSGCEGRLPFGAKALDGETTIGPALVEINLGPGLSEKGASSFLGSVPNTGYADLLRTLGEIDDDEDTKGIFLRIGLANVSFSIATELGDQLYALRTSKNIPVYCHADDLDNGTILLASKACSEIWVSPAGGVDSVGIAFSLIFGKSLLDKIGVGVDYLQVGKYKGAQEPFTRDEPSPEARESLEGTLRDLRKAWVEGVSEGRGKNLEEVLEDGPYTGAKAIELGLIDKVGYLDDAKEAAKKAVGAQRTNVVFGGGPQNPGGFAQMVQALSGSDVEGMPHVAVVRAIGAITMGPSGGLGGSDGITETGLGKTLTSLTKDENVKAVVLRIDSPGGSALASDLLWHKLMKLREKKPLIISVGGMAASGGYYLSCAGNKIFAEPTSIVGSIGVVGGKFALHDPLAKIGVNTVTISVAPDEKRRRRASYMSPFDRWDDATRARVLEGMTGIYNTFIDRIVEGRGLERAVVEASAEGRIFGGATAKERQLVDEVGGLDAAIAYALEQAGLGADGKVRIKAPGGGLLELLGGDEDAAARAAQNVEAKLDPLARIAEGLPEETRVWFASASPMARGETMITALPFVLMSR